MDAPKKPGYISPRTKRAESELKAMLRENGAMDLYEAPLNDDLSNETSNQRTVRRSRIKKNFNRKKQGRGPCHRRQEKTQQPATAEELANRRRRKALKMRKWRASMTPEEKTAYRLKDAERKKHPISWRPYSPDREIFIRINDYTGEVDRCDKGRCLFSVSKRSTFNVCWEEECDSDESRSSASDEGSASSRCCVISRIPTFTKMKVVFEVFANAKGISQKGLCFMLNGEAIDPDVTCKNWDEGNDEIDCFLATRSEHNKHTHPDYPYVVNDEWGQEESVLRPHDLQKKEIILRYIVGGGEERARDGLGYTYNGAFRLNLEDPESADLHYLGRLSADGEFVYDKGGFRGKFDYRKRSLFSNQHWFRGKLRQDPYNPAIATSRSRYYYNEGEMRDILSTLTMNQFIRFRKGQLYGAFLDCFGHFVVQIEEGGRTNEQVFSECKLSTQHATLFIGKREDKQFLSVIHHMSHEHCYPLLLRTRTRPRWPFDLWPWQEKCRICLQYSPLPASVANYIKEHHGNGKVEVNRKDVVVIYEKLAGCKSCVGVSFEYIDFLQCSMEWGDPLHFCAWKRICEVVEGRSMTKEEIMNTPQAIDWGHRPYLDSDSKRVLRPRHLQKEELRITGPDGFVYAFVNLADQKDSGLQYLGRDESITHISECKYDENFKGEYDYRDRYEDSNDQWFRGIFRNAYASGTGAIVCTIDELMLAKIQIQGRRWKGGKYCCVGDFINGSTDYAMTFSVSKLTGNEFELKILHSFSLRHGSTDWTWAEEFDIGITCGPLSQDVVDELERLYGNNRQWTNNISPRIIRAEEELKALLSEKDAMDLYEGPPNNDLSYETPNKRKARRFRIKINMTDRDEGREKERLSKKRLMKNVDTGSFDYGILRRQGGVKVKFDYIIFKQSSMEWGILSISSRGKAYASEDNEEV